MNYNRTLSRKATYQINIKKIAIWLYALCAVCNVWLAFNSSKYSPLYEMVTSLIVYLTPLFGVAILLVSKHTRIKRENLLFIILPTWYWLLLVFNTREGYSGDWIVSLITIAIFLVLDDETKMSIFQKFYYIIQAQNLVAVLIYLAFILNLRFIFTRVPFYYNDTSLGYYYLKVGIWGIVSNDMTLSYRLCGIFNEAGGLGTICALLFAGTFKFTRPFEKTLLLATIVFSFSFAGYLILFIFFGIYLVKKDIRNILWLVLLVVFFLSIPNIDWHNDALNILAQRFSLVNGGLSGDNRTTNLFDSRFNEMLHSSKIWLGYGAGYSLAPGVLSYKMLIVEFGIVGALALFGSWIFAILKAAKKDLDCLLFGVIYILSLYQRPAPVRSLLGFVLIFGGFAYIRAMNSRFGRQSS